MFPKGDRVEPVALIPYVTYPYDHLKNEKMNNLIPDKTYVISHRPFHSFSIIFNQGLRAYYKTRFMVLRNIEDTLNTTKYKVTL